MADDTADREKSASKADANKPIRHENLTLPEVEKVLDSCKLRGSHGG